MKVINGIGVGDDIRISKAFLLQTPEINISNEPASNVDTELATFNKALELTKEQINQIKTASSDKLSAEQLGVFDAHLMIVSDPELVNNVTNMINEGNNAVFSIDTVCNNFISMFSAMEDEYFKQRASDVADIRTRLLSNACGIKIPDLTLIDEECVLISYDLTPSETAQLNKEFVQGFVTSIGGRTSHACIMAKSMGIPALVGCGEVINEINDQDTVIIDTVNSKLIVNPDESTLNEYQTLIAKLREQQEFEKSFMDKESITKDGVKKIIASNIGTPQDAIGAVENGAEAIGLFRSEFLYMDKTELPSEDEQFEAYKSVLETMNGKQVIVRTLDIGGDKELDYLNIEAESNPFLGYRAIRICLDQTDIFKTQLRALVRASAYGNLGIMFPMIATIDELRDAKKILEEVKQELINEGVEIGDKIEVGMMIEIPSACIMADLFAKEVDFFSIGTNDLIQYTMACDRMSEKVSYLYQPYNPAVLRMINIAIKAAHESGIWIGMCGEMASDPLAQLILLAMGLDEFSMSSSNILQSRANFANLNVGDLVPHLDNILNLTTSEEVEEYVKTIK